MGDPESVAPPPGQQYQIVSLKSNPGKRYWVEIAGGVVPAGISIFDDGTLVGVANSTTQLNFTGSGVTAIGSDPGVAATVRFFAPGSTRGLLFNDNGNFNTTDTIIFDNINNRLGIGSTSPETKLDVNGDIKLLGTIYDSNNFEGGQGEILVKSATGGLVWEQQADIVVGAGGTIFEVQFHNTAGFP